MADTTGAQEDPLTALLPPRTDYLTYLTLLEYQLKPQNLHTLNGLLSSDDGSLAKETGWDLLRIVLPMLDEAADEAKKCLEIISRRGNPREVVVRVAEELEKLGLHEEEEQDFDEDRADEDTGANDLPTFAGEAARIHLGEMKLDGMPEEDLDPSFAESANALKTGGKEDSDPITFDALLSMLGIVHPRIKTQFPSRFLATSLPAALGSYRRMPTSLMSTKSFLACLRDLNETQRPPLPPRTSTANGASHVAAPLPDPEATAEASAGTNIASDNENAIITRLLQAVMLEIVEEFATALKAHEVPSMLWTKRLREQDDPKRELPRVQTVSELWKSDDELRQRDELMSRFVALAKELRLDISDTISGMVAEKASVQKAETNDENGDQQEEPSEYPKQPTDVPFSLAGVILLHACVSFHERLSESKLGLDAVHNIFEELGPLSEVPKVLSPTVSDALLCTLYEAVRHDPQQTVSQIDGDGFKELVSILTQVFMISPYPQTRDDAHYLASKLLHARAAVDDRVTIIKQTISGSCCGREGQHAGLIPLAPPFSQGTLKSIGADWLKDEILAHMRDNSAGISPQAFESDTVLMSLICPEIPQLADGSTQPAATVTGVLLSLPFYISILNLAYVLASINDESTGSKLVDHVEQTLVQLEKWKGYLVSNLSEDEAIRDSAPDIFAFEDACRRVGGKLKIGGTDETQTPVVS